VKGGAQMSLRAGAVPGEVCGVVCVCVCVRVCVCVSCCAKSSPLLILQRWRQAVIGVNQMSWRAGLVPSETCGVCGLVWVWVWVGVGVGVGVSFCAGSSPFAIFAALGKVLHFKQLGLWLDNAF